MKIKKTPLSIYIHIPFCKKKCLYCDFLSAPACGQERESYVKALLREISFMADKASEYEVISIFLGGGTPSLLNKSQVERIMSAIRKEYCLTQDCEITIECNPATADYDKLAYFKACGINRLSIGLQSANDKELKELGRIHNYRQFLETFKAARKAGFTNINIDIMSALPGQTVESYTDTLQKVIALNPEHISAYSLIIEEGTPFYDRYGENREASIISKANEAAQSIDYAPMYPSLPDEDTERKMYHVTKMILEKAGYLRYEISNYAKKNYECRHNLTYWTGISYLGFGIGAASYFKGYRFKNRQDIQTYEELFSNNRSLMLQSVGRKEWQCMQSNVAGQMIFHNFHEEIQSLSVEEQMEEFMFLGLRMMDGVKKADFRQQFQKDMDVQYGKVLQKLEKQGMIKQTQDTVMLTARGIDVSNVVLAEFLL